MMHIVPVIYMCAEKEHLQLEHPGYQQSICQGDSNILLVLKRSTYHQGRVVYIVFSSLRNLFLRQALSLVSTIDLHDPVLSTSVVIHDSYPFCSAAADYHFFCNLSTGVYKRVFLARFLTLSVLSVYRQKVMVLVY
jgi:hypothetical protein